MSWKTWTLIALLFGSPVALLVYWRHGVNAFYADQEGTITAVLFLLSCFTFAAQMLYRFNQEFYLIVHRALLYVRPTHTYWKLAHALSDADNEKLRAALTTNSASRRAIDEAVKSRAWGSVMPKHGVNYLEWTVDDRDRLRLEIDVEDRSATLTSSKLKVPAYEYRYMIARLTAICGAVEREFHPRDIQSRLVFTFAERNPYFGFFVTRIPRELVQSFRCAFTTRDSVGRGCTVTATEDDILVDGTDRECVAEVAITYLTLAGKLGGPSGAR